MRGKDYALLDLPPVQARLALPPDEQTTHPETGTCRALFDCPDLLLSPTGPRVRVVVASHATTTSEAKIGTTRGESVYEFFYTALPVGAFTAAEVVALYLHRGAFETVLADEDQEQDPDRWCSHTPCGQQFWQMLSQWVWNVRLQLGHALHPEPVRTSEFAPVHPPQAESLVVPPPIGQPGPPVEYGPPKFARPSFPGGFPGSAFVLQADGTLRCPADHPLYPQERVRSAMGPCACCMPLALVIWRMPGCRAHVVLLCSSFLRMANEAQLKPWAEPAWPRCGREGETCRWVKGVVHDWLTRDRARRTRTGFFTLRARSFLPEA
jgi:hypothetical protein